MGARATRRFRLHPPRPRIGRRAYIGDPRLIAVPAGGATASFVEAAGKVRFTARWADVAGRIVNINAKKL